MAKVSIEKVDGSVQISFNDSSHYMYKGVAQWPLNSLAMFIDSSNMVTFKNAAGDIVYSITLSDLDKTKEEMEEMYSDVFVGSTGGGSGVTQEEVAEMIDEATSGKADTSAVTSVSNTLTAHTSDTDIHVTASDKSTWSGKQDALTAGEGIAISGNVVSNTAPFSEDTELLLSAALNEHETKINTISGNVGNLQTEVQGKQDALTAGNGISIDTGNVISVTAQTGGANIVEVTQAEYNALVTGGTVDPDVLYIITDASVIDMTNYYTSAQTDSAIAAAVSGKADTSAVTSVNNTITAHTADTTIHVTSSDKTTWNGKQDALSAGTGIDITNNVISVTGGSSATVDQVLDSTTSGSTNAISSAAMWDVTNGVKLLPISQSDYDDLVNDGLIDQFTLYIIY